MKVTFLLNEYATHKQTISDSKGTNRINFERYFLEFLLIMNILMKLQKNSAYFKQVMQIFYTYTASLRSIIPNNN